MSMALRVTDEPTMEIAEMVLNRVNKSLVQMVNELGIKAVGISGKGRHDVKMQKNAIQTERTSVLWGDITQVDPQIINDLAGKGISFPSSARWAFDEDFEDL